MAGIRLIDPRESERRLKCGLAARGGQPLLVIGRTDALPALGIDEAVARALRYQDAGVDLVFVDGVKTVAEVEAIARRVPGPKVVSIVDGTEAVALGALQLQAMGFAVVLYAVTALFSAARAVQQALATLQQDGSPRGVPAMSYSDFSEVVRLPEHHRLDDQFGAA
jgi:2-methylisocitrate lyase-like PEP mutase family enzyme